MVGILCRLGHPLSSSYSRISLADPEFHARCIFCGTLLDADRLGHSRVPMRALVFVALILVGASATAWVRASLPHAASVTVKVPPARPAAPESRSIDGNK